MFSPLEDCLSRQRNKYLNKSFSRSLSHTGSHARTHTLHSRCCFSCRRFFIDSVGCLSARICRPWRTTTAASGRRAPPDPSDYCFRNTVSLVTTCSQKNCLGDRRQAYGSGKRYQFHHFSSGLLRKEEGKCGTATGVHAHAHRNRINARGFWETLHRGLLAFREMDIMVVRVSE